MLRSLVSMPRIVGVMTETFISFERRIVNPETLPTGPLPMPRRRARR